MSKSLCVVNSNLFFASKGLTSKSCTSIPLSEHSHSTFGSSLRLQSIKPNVGNSAPSRLHSCRAVESKSNVTEQSIDELPENLQRIVKSFQSVADPRARYQQLLFFASRLKPLAKEHQIPANKVQGCVSQVWVLLTVRDGRVYFEAESDSALTKGLAALLVEGLSGSTPAQVLAITPDFIQQLGLKQSLTPSRNNGFLNMLRLMQKKTMEYELSKNKDQHSSELQVETPPGDVIPGTTSEVEGSLGDEVGSAKPSSQSLHPIYDSMHAKISQALSPKELIIDDISYQHKGHAGVSSGLAETHFNVKVISELFEGVSTIKRHRIIYALLNDEFKSGLHALSIVAKTPNEIQA